MGKTIPENVQTRLRKALLSAAEWQQESHQTLNVFTGSAGIKDIYSLEHFYVYDPSFPPPSRVNLSLGKFHGILDGFMVYEPPSFSPEIIEIASEKGEFLYTLDLSEEKAGG